MNMFHRAFSVPGAAGSSGYKRMNPAKPLLSPEGDNKQTKEGMGGVEKQSRQRRSLQCSFSSPGLSGWGQPDNQRTQEKAELSQGVSGQGWGLEDYIFIL